MDRSSPIDPEATLDATGAGGRVRLLLDRQTAWLQALLILATIAAAFVVLGFIAQYFQDYFRIILIFTLAWLLAFLVSPVADWIQRRLTRLPRAIAVLIVIVPLIVLAALIAVRVLAAIAESFAQLAAALPGLIAHPPAILGDIQTWLDERGINVDVVKAFETFVADVLKGMTDLMVGLLGAAVQAAGSFVDGIIVISLAVFMTIDKERILNFGLELTPPDRRPRLLLFRQRVATAFGGFVRSQVLLGALYGVWALVVSVLFGLPFALAIAFLAGLIMAIPIYGPYVSWLPPVFVALLTNPGVAVVVAVAMLIGWFIDENILAPIVRAGALEMHPIVVTLAFLLGAQMAGAIGALIAIPLAAVIQAFVMEYIRGYEAGRGWIPAATAAAAGPPPPDAPAPAAER